MPGKRYHIIFLIILIPNLLCSQLYLKPEMLSQENGLSSDDVNSITLDRRGFIWAGTNTGLNRYDGYRFVHFLTALTIPQTVRNLAVSTVSQDTYGNYWIVTDAGLFFMDGRTGLIESISLSTETAASITYLKIIDLAADNEGKIWILGEQQLLKVSVGKSPEVFSIASGFYVNGRANNCLLTDINNQIWIGTSDGILIFNKEQNDFSELLQQGSSGLLSNSNIKCFFRSNDNTVWIGTDNGLNRFDPVDFDFDQFYPSGLETASAGNVIKCITQERDKKLVMATEAGISVFDNETNQFFNALESDEIRVNDIAVDSTGIIWGATSQGLLKIRKSMLPVTNYSANSGNLRLSDNRVATMGISGVNSLFIGYNSREYDFVDLNRETVSRFNTRNGGNPVDFHPFKNGILVASNFDIELVTNGNQAKSLFDMYTFMNRTTLDQPIQCVKVDRHENIWIGTSAGLQLIRFDSSRLVTLKVLRFQNQRLDIGAVYDIEEDTDGKLWIGTHDGLVGYTPETGEFYKYTPYDKALLNTEHKVVYAIVPESPDVLWIGSSGGAYSFDLKTREFSVVGDDPLLLKSAVTALTVDNSRNLWFGTTRGLYYYARNSGTLFFFDHKDGLINNNYTALVAGNNGRVYLGGNQGFSVVNTNEMHPEPIPFEVLITSVHFIENEPMKDHYYHYVTDTIVLPWSKTPIQIDFASTNMSRPENNRFKYSLGDKDDWYQLGSQNYVILDHLQPGTYTLRVEGSVNGTSWSNMRSLCIIIETPGWRSKTALFIYISLLVLFVVVFFRFWRKQFFKLSRENQQREMFAKQIMMQKEELTLKNKSITDSINYAKRIQTAMLPPQRLFKSIFTSSFVLYMPKDIVSGDFYWINKLNNKIFFAAVDCTGHGVPGAFMSIIGFELFRKITNIEGLSRPSDILNRLNEDFHVIFKDVDNVVLRDGMDVAFCSIDKNDMILEFSGAFNPLYLIRDNKITEIKGDRFAIGLDETNFKEQTFKNHLIPIQKGDIIYIFSDGFADQFGGPDGKKYKYRRFRHLLLTLHQLPMEKQHEILENNVMEWRGEQEQVDDILVIGIKIDF